MTFKVGDRVRVVMRGRDHTGKSGTVVEISDFRIAPYDVRFEGDQRVWLDEGDSYEVPYGADELELIVEEVRT